VPAELQFTVGIFGQSFPAYNIFLVAVGLIIALLLWYVFNHTRVGKIIRAASEDRDMANALGIRVPTLFTAVFVVGCILAGLGGALASPYRAIQPSMGENIIVQSFIVVVIGGIGSFPGTLAAALLLGIVDSLAFLYIPSIRLFIPYLLMIAILLWRPTGLFGGAEV
jgi:branched-chain amino acid transport system permease protein